MPKAILGFAVVSAFLVLTFQNCSDPVKFSENMNKSMSSSVAFHDTATKTMMQDFSVNSSVLQNQTAMDIIWIVDNSGSMSQEAAWVEDNVVSFANYLANSSDARLTLISQNGGATGVYLPRNDARMAQIEQTISSTNSLTILSALMNNQHQHSSAFLARWRTGVPKAIVVVTDDDSRVSAADFKASIPSSMAKDIKSFNSIVGISKAQSPCQARSGEVYKELSSNLSGQVYNICEENWSSIFTSLALNIENQFGSPSQTRFALAEQSIDRVTGVFVNGVEVSSANYSVLGNNVTISKTIFLNQPAATYKVSIEFIYR